MMEGSMTLRTSARLQDDFETHGPDKSGLFGKRPDVHSGFNPVCQVRQTL